MFSVLGHLDEKLGVKLREVVPSTEPVVLVTKFRGALGPLCLRAEFRALLLYPGLASLARGVLGFGKEA